MNITAPRFGARLEIQPLVGRLWGDQVVQGIQAEASNIAALPADIEKVEFSAFGVDESEGYRQSYSRYPGDNDLNVAVYRKGQGQPEFTHLGNSFKDFSIAMTVAPAWVTAKVKEFISKLR